MLIRASYIDMIRRTALRHGKMAFVTGPRQVGKTTLARQIFPSGGRYFTWDDVTFRRAWIKDPKALVPQAVGARTPIILDELHKAPGWKSRLKGLFDTRGESAEIVVTGSARLDLFRRGGDSLIGRSFAFRLHPLSVGEIAGSPPPSPDAIEARLSRSIAGDDDVVEALLAFGGFPEPFLKKDSAFLNVWRRTRVERLVREDLLDIARAHEISLMEAAAALLPERVGSPLSVQALAGDLDVSHPTMRRWLSWFGQLYYSFTIPPFVKATARSLKKQPKLYLWDWSEIQDPGARLENLVAGHLHKAVHFYTDAGLGVFDLVYVRDKEKREVDFLVVRDRKPWLLAEVKLSDTAPSPHLGAFAAALNPRLVIQVVATPGVHERFDLGAGDKGTIISAGSFLKLLP